MERHTRSIGAAALALLFLLLSINAWAQASPAKGYKIASKPPLPAELAEPGTRQNSIYFQVQNARDVIDGVRAVAILDGKFMEVPVLGGYLNKFDRPEYFIDLTAPLFQLSYQIMVPNGDGTYSWSERFSVRRKCIPDTSVINTDAALPSGSEVVQAYDARARSLERELNAYDHVLALLDEIRADLNMEGN